MHILVTGSNGQLGNEIREIAPNYPQYNFIFTDIDELDISKKKNINSFFDNNKVDCVINCAAYTDVDKAEEDSKNAHLLNVLAVKYLAQACGKRKIDLMHISTDYVFDGNNFRPYRETDFTNPHSIYGKTKLEGEEMIEEFANTAIIIRTSWLYSSFNNNFVKTMLKYGEERDELKVVYDQVGAPTYAADLAKMLVDNIEDLQWINGTHTYHYANEGVCSWYDFAKAIMELSGTDCKVTPIETKDYPLPAKRPAYSIFNKSKIKDNLESIEIPYWKDSLKICLQKIKENK